MRRIRFLNEREDGDLKQTRSEGMQRIGEGGRREIMIAIPLAVWVPIEEERTLAELQAKAGAWVEGKLDQAIAWEAPEMAEDVAKRRDEAHA